MTLHPHVRSWRAVLDLAAEQRIHNTIVHKYGQCLGTSRQLYGFPTTGLVDATASYRHTTQLHRAGDPPKGAHVMWTGGSKGHGHSSVSAGGGKVYSVDFGGQPRLYLASIATINRVWSNLHYQGWSTDYAGRYQLDVQGYDALGHKVVVGSDVLKVRGTASTTSKLNGRATASTSARVVVVRPAGYRLEYTSVVTTGGRQWLRTAWGTYYAASFTTYGAK